MHEVSIPGDTFLHRWDARCKLVCVLLLAFSATALTGFARPVLFLLAALGALLLARLSPKHLLGRLGALHIFLLPFFLFLPFTAPGETRFELGPLAVTLEGFELALAIYLRALAVATLALALVLTTPMDLIVHAADRLHAPRVLTQITLLTYRFLFTFRVDWHRVRVALRTRGFRPAPRMHTYRTLANALGGLFIRSCDRTERVTHAMRCRGYRGRMPTLREFAIRRSDICAAAVSLLAGGLFLTWEFYP